MIKLRLSLLISLIWPNLPILGTNVPYIYSSLWHIYIINYIKINGFTSYLYLLSDTLLFGDWPYFFTYQDVEDGSSSVVLAEDTILVDKAGAGGDADCCLPVEVNHSPLSLLTYYGSLRIRISEFLRTAVWSRSCLGGSSIVGFDLYEVKIREVLSVMIITLMEQPSPSFIIQLPN